MSDTHILIALRIISELSAAAQRAQELGRDMTREELRASSVGVFERVDAADDKWRDSGN